MHATIIASLAALAVAAPVVERRQAAAPPAGVNDATILQYALTLEHLENAFYREGIQKFKSADFVKAGLAPSFYNNLQQIKKDEQTHVDFLTAGLKAAGAAPVAECKYNFGIKDVPTFLAIANVLEGVGVSAYLGAAKYIQSPDYLTAAGSILTVESRHSAYLRESQRPALSPFPSPFDIPLEFSPVKSLAAPFFVSCPSPSSLDLLSGFQAFPTILVAPSGVAKGGDTLYLKVAEKVPATNAWFITSNGAVPAKLSRSSKDSGSGPARSYKITVPSIGVPNLQPGTVNAGQGYLVLTKDDKKPTDDNTVAGPAVVQLADNAFGRAADSPSYGKDSSYQAPQAPKSY